MKEFDNIEIKDMFILLNENATLQRYFPLIPLCDKLTKILLKLGISDKYMFFSEMEANADKLERKLGIETDMLKLLDSFLHLHDFISRKLREIHSVDEVYISALIDDKIKTSKDYMLLCMIDDRKTIADKYNVSTDDVVHLFNICDLMRLPGVKDTRSSLYYDCGYKSLQDFADNNTEDMRKNIEQYIIATKSDKSVPLKKELSTQIAVAKVLPHIFPKQ